MERLIDNYLVAIQIRSNITGIPINEYTVDEVVRDLCNFEESYNDISLIGEGGYGVVIKAFMKNSTVLPLAIKISRSKDDFKLKEVYIMKRLMNDILRNNISPHVPIYLCTYTCKEIDIEDFNSNNSGVIVMELLGLTLSNLMNDEDFKNIEIYLFQLYLLLYVLDEIFINFNHNDIHTGNIVFRDSISEGYTLYDYRGRQYFLPNTGKQLVLIDYGISEIESSKKENNDWYFELSQLITELEAYDYNIQARSYIELLNSERFKEFSIPKDDIKLYFKL